MKILVTGCAGYIGSLLVKKLVKSYHVIGVDNFIYKNQYSISELCGNKNFEFYNKDVIDLPKNILSKADVIIPLAAIVGAPACDKKKTETINTNYYAIQKMVNNLSKNQRIIYPNTNSGYGTSGEEICTEESPIVPISTYGITKCQGEKVVLSHKNAVSLRLATVCGVSPRMRFDLMVNDFCAKIYFKQNFEVYEANYKRNFVHINDVVRAFMFMITQNVNGVYNIGHPHGNITKASLLELISEHYGIYDNFIMGKGSDPDQRNYFVSSEKIKDEGFHFLHTINNAIEEVAKVCSMYNYKDILKLGNV